LVIRRGRRGSDRGPHGDARGDCTVRVIRSAIDVVDASARPDRHITGGSTDGNIPSRSGGHSTATDTANRGPAVGPDRDPGSGRTADCGPAVPPDGDTTAARPYRDAAATWPAINPAAPHAAGTATAAATATKGRSVECQRQHKNQAKAGHG